MTVGSTDSFSKCLSMFNGDTVLFDEYAYGSAVATSRTHGRTNVGVRMDTDGMIPADLKKQIALARDKGLDPDMGKWLNMLILLLIINDCSPFSGSVFGTNCSKSYWCNDVNKKERRNLSRVPR